MFAFIELAMMAASEIFVLPLYVRTGVYPSACDCYGLAMDHAAISCLNLSTLLTGP